MKRGALDKKGAELSLNTIIVWVLGAVALVVIVYFFMSGTGKTSGSISDIFKTATAGVSRDLAIETCEQRCESIRDKSKFIAENSAYCKGQFKIDDDGDGVPEEYMVDANRRATVKFYCYRGSPRTGEESLRVDCILDPPVSTQVACGT